VNLNQTNNDIITLTYIYIYLVDETKHIKKWNTTIQGKQLMVLLKCLISIVLLFFFLLNTSLNFKIILQSSQDIATNFNI